MKTLSEEQVAGAVVELLRGLDWDVYQEVVVPGGRVDIVARRRATIWAIEAKVSMGLKVLEQAATWRGHANYVSVAIAGHASPFSASLCRHLGMGVFTVRSTTEVSIDRRSYRDWLNVDTRVEPVLARRRSQAIEKRLREEQRDWAPAGNASSAYYTPWQAVSKRIAELAAERPGIALKEALDALGEAYRYHYGKAPVARNVADWLKRGIVPGVRIEGTGTRQMRIYPAEATP